MVGKEILGYHVDEKIGSGRFGTVYRVSKTNAAGTYVRALKHITLPTKKQYASVLNSMGGDYEKADDYFTGVLDDIVNEIKIFSTLSESGVSNIVRYYENDIIETFSPKTYDIYILMEYLTPFTDYISDKTVTVGDVIKLGIDILNALVSCHEKNIIHRDIKDDNLFVSRDGSYKLGDFGVSKVLKNESRAESVKGTPNFIAPEVYLGKEKYDNTVDVYSLGIVLYKLLNKMRVPFLPAFPASYSTTDEDAAFEARMKGQIPELPLLAQNELGQVVLKAILPREQRYDSAKDFLSALRKVEVEMTKEQLAVVACESIMKSATADTMSDSLVFSGKSSDETIDMTYTICEQEDEASEDRHLFDTISISHTSKEVPENYIVIDSTSDFWKDHVPWYPGIVLDPPPPLKDDSKHQESHPMGVKSVPAPELSVEESALAPAVEQTIEPKPTPEIVVEPVPALEAPVEESDSVPVDEQMVESAPAFAEASVEESALAPAVEQTIEPKPTLEVVVEPVSALEAQVEESALAPAVEKQPFEKIPSQTFSANDDSSRGKEKGKRFNIPKWLNGVKERRSPKNKTNIPATNATATPTPKIVLENIYLFLKSNPGVFDKETVETLRVTIDSMKLNREFGTANDANIASVEHDICQLILELQQILVANPEDLRLRVSDCVVALKRKNFLRETMLKKYRLVSDLKQRKKK